MARNAVIHIGMHKSGSSYLQTLLTENADALRAWGVDVMVGVKNDVRPFTKVARPARRKGKSEPPFEPSGLERRLSDLSEDRHLFLSCESLEALGKYPEALQSFEDRIACRYDRLEYMLIVRHVIEYLSSNIQQRIKSFRQADYRRNTQLSQNHSLDSKFGALLDKRDRVRLVRFDDLIKGDTPMGLAALIRDSLGPDCKLEDMAQANAGIGAQGVAIALCLNWLIRKSLGGTVPQEWRRRGKIGNLMAGRIRQAGKDKRKFQPFTDGEQREIVRQTKAESEAFLDAFRIAEGRPDVRECCSVAVDLPSVR